MGLKQNAFTGILRQRNMSVIGHLQKLRPHSVLVSVSPTDLASFTSFVLACNSFFFFLSISVAVDICIPKRVP